MKAKEQVYQITLEKQLDLDLVMYQSQDLLLMVVEYIFTTG
jgi:hypothetical protein